MATPDTHRRHDVATIEPLKPEERALIMALRELNYGTLEIVVHQSRVVQFTRSAKLRFD